MSEYLGTWNTNIIKGGLFQLTKGATTGYILRCKNSIGQGEWVNPALYGVKSIQGTQNQVLASGTYGSQQVGDIILTLPQDIATTSSPSFSTLNLSGTTTLIDGLTLSYTPNASIQGLTSYKSGGLHRWQWTIQGLETGGNAGSNLNLEFYDDTGTIIDNLVSFDRLGGNASFVNEVSAGGGFTGQILTPSQLSITTLPALTSIQGQSLSTSVWPYVSVLNQNLATSSSPTFANITASTKTTTSTFQLTTGATNGYVLRSDASGNGTWQSLASFGVSSITGTTNQIIASASTGAITLSTPQDIATSSSPTFNLLTLTKLNSGAGTVSLPSIYLNSDTTTGLYSGSVGQLAITCGGTLIATFGSTGISVNSKLVSGISSLSANFVSAIAGSVSLPALTLVDSGTGFYRPASNQIGISCNGSLIGTWSSTGLAMNSLVISGISTLTTTNLAGTTLTGTLNLNSNNITNGATITATTLAGTLSTASQPNITTLGGLTSIRGQSVASTAWQYVNSMNQAVSTSSSPSFTAATITTLTVPNGGSFTTSQTNISGDVAHWLLKASNSNRWGVGLQGTESSGNAGSDFALFNYADNGTSFLSDALVIKRSNNKLTISGPVSLSTVNSNTNGNLTSGIYTPTIANVSNVDVANSSAFDHSYQRIGSQVMVMGRFSIRPSGTVSVLTFTLTLPYTVNNFANSGQASGPATGIATGPKTSIGTVVANSGTQTVIVSLPALNPSVVSTDNVITYYSFCYQIV